MRIDQVHLHDWCFLYIDGELVYHHHDSLSGSAWETLEPLLYKLGIETHDWTPEDEDAYKTLAEMTNWRRVGPPQKFEDMEVFVVEGYGGYF
jgi:hypothetical protein